MWKYCKGMEGVAVYVQGGAIHRVSVTPPEDGEYWVIQEQLAYWAQARRAIGDTYGADVGDMDSLVWEAGEGRGESVGFLTTPVSVEGEDETMENVFRSVGECAETARKAEHARRVAAVRAIVEDVGVDGLFEYLEHVAAENEDTAVAKYGRGNPVAAQWRRVQGIAEQAKEMFHKLRPWRRNGA